MGGHVKKGRLVLTKAIKEVRGVSSCILVNVGSQILIDS